ncbi:MAG: murein biosynthesis integral membrane protein MurJ [Anaerosomatales bacterium]|nr:murein biosynthesis integral membrane protein MurJ [Anaerosomatales bacterium]
MYTEGNGSVSTTRTARPPPLQSCSHAARPREPPIDKKPSIARSTATMSVATTLSRVTGFARTWAMAYALGVTVLSASYQVANNIPNMIYELVAGGTLSSVFIPLFIERMQRDGKDEAWRFASTVLNITVLALGLVALAGTLVPEPFVRTQTFRISPEKAALAVHLFRFFAVQVVFYGALAIWTGVLQSHRRFVAPAVAPIFNNVVVIVTMLFVYLPLKDAHPQAAIDGLAIGTTLGVAAMALVQVPALIRIGAKFHLSIDWRHPGLKKLAAKMAPMVVYTIINLVCISFRNAYAFQTSETGPAVLAYAWNFYQLPYGVFAIALSTAIFPEIASLADARDWDGFKRMFVRGLRSLSVIMLPLAAMLIALATPVIRLYRAGNFTASDVPVVAEVLVWWAAGLLFMAANMYVLRTFYALQDTKTPMVTNFFGSILQVSLYALLTSGIGSWKGIGLAGIPVADGVFFALHLSALLVILRRKVGPYGLGGIVSTVAKTALSSLAGAVAAAGFVRATPGLSGPGVFVAQLVAAGIIGLGVSYGIAALLGVSEVSSGVRRARQMVSSRFARGRR